MNLLNILEVAIGIFFVWLLVSTVVNSFQELLVSQLQGRAKDLKMAIQVVGGETICQCLPRG